MARENVNERDLKSLIDLHYRAFLFNLENIKWATNIFYSFLGVFFVSIGLILNAFGISEITAIFVGFLFILLIFAYLVFNVYKSRFYNTAMSNKSEVSKLYGMYFKEELPNNLF